MFLLLSQNESRLPSADKPTKTGFGEGVLEAAKQNPNIVGIGVDITKSVGMNLFAEAYPDRFITLGVAEQNAVGVSAE